MANGFVTSDVISIIAIVLSVVSFILTLYYNHLRGSDIQLIMSSDSNMFLNKVKITRKCPQNLRDNTSAIGLPFDAAFINKGNHAGSIFRVWENQVNIKDLYILRVLKTKPQIRDFHLEKRPNISSLKVIQPGEIFPIEYILTLDGTKESIRQFFMDRNEIKFEIFYRVTHRNSIKTKKLPVTVELSP